MKLKLTLNWKTNVIKPIIATVIMGIIVAGMYHLCNMMLGNTISTLLAIVFGVVVYGIAIILMKILSKEDIMMIPFGTKIYQLLVKLHIY